MAMEVLGSLGHTPRLVASGGGSDVNALIRNGFPAVNLCNGMIDAHTPDERIAVDEPRADARRHPRPDRRGARRVVTARRGRPRPADPHASRSTAGTIVNLRGSDYRRPDGTVVRREVMDHPGAVVMVPVEDDHVLLVRQPREAVERYTLELPAGKLDHPGEDPLDCARRELAEEVGRAAGTWRDLGGFYTAPAILTEFIHCFMATDLTAVDGVAGDEDEAIEVVAWPLADLDGLIDTVRDAKTLIGLLRLERETGAG